MHTPRMCFKGDSDKELHRTQPETRPKLTKMIRDSQIAGGQTFRLELGEPAYVHCVLYTAYQCVESMVCCIAANAVVPY